MPEESPESIFEAACRVLTTQNALDKANAARSTVRSWAEKKIVPRSAGTKVPDRPARPDKPVLAAPGDMPRRRLGSLAGRQALLHAIAHIELNAIDLAFDMVARFGPDIDPALQHEFISDWLSVGDDEARHFLMISDRLLELDLSYGDLPAHDGLWEAALATNDDVLARLSIAPLVLEARGLDVTPQMIDNLGNAGDQTSANILKIIYDEEIGHVALGVKWLTKLAEQNGQAAETCFRHYVQTRFKGTLKEPFNHEARAKAGFEKKFYANITN